MRIQHPLLKLPIRFDAATLAREVEALPAAAWTSHPQNLEGNLAVRLVSPGGQPTDEWAGGMAATDHLRALPYVQEVMRALGGPWGRSRLMGLEPGSTVPHHVDVHYYWRTHLRIHVPVITNPQVRFTCDGTTVHMAPGECWLLDSFFPHSVENAGEALRVHLVLDTVGNEKLWDLIQAGAAGAGEAPLVAPGSTPPAELQFEQINAPAIMSPWEIKCHIAYILDWTDDQPALAEVRTILDRFVMAWSGTWARHGAADAGIPGYLRHLTELKQQLAAVAGEPIAMRNGWPLLDSLQRYVLVNAILPAKLMQLRAAAEQHRQARVSA